MIYEIWQNDPFTGPKGFHIKTSVTVSTSQSSKSVSMAGGIDHGIAYRCTCKITDNSAIKAGIA